MKTLNFGGTTSVLKRSKYTDDESLAIIAFDKQTQEIQLVVTVNSGMDIKEENVAVVKDYSENKGIMPALKEAGVVKKVIGAVQVGYSVCPVVEFDLTDIEWV